MTMMPIKYVTYKGAARPELTGQTAMVMNITGNTVFVQFNDLNLGDWAFGRHAFPLADFDVTEIEDWPET